eukprot:Phypoly_transcript_07128.p1 GENE.Phypoly_transcript_07128~~Phypoly_transcript_07128.p1  ORF type:complete len:527 (+),score=108.36 Phypoly_transcript_07128:67-1647(+)
MFKILILFSLFISLLPVFSQVTNPTQADLDANDNKVLQLAITLENLDSSYFDYFQTVFNRSAFIAAGYAGSVWDVFDLIRTQEEAHVSILQSTFQQRTGQTMPKCNYTFDFITTVAEYVGGARLLENVGTGAYDGSFGAIYNRTLQQAAATIATVEGRHAAYLNQLPGSINLPSLVPNATSPFPNATDYALSPTTVASFIMPFISSCPYDVTTIIPQIEIVIPVAAPNASYPANPSQDQVNANDMLALNYALALETFEATFYNQHLGVTNYTQSDFMAAGFSADVYNYLLLIREQENAHVSYLESTITSLGGTPIANCTFRFNLVTNASNFVTVAQLVESAGVSAYDGAVNTIFDPHLRQAAATLATVEARHSAFLNELLNQSSFPSSTDTAASPATTIAQISAFFISSCPTPIPVPQSLVVTPYSNTTTTGNSTTGNSTSGNTTAASTATTASATATAASSTAHAASTTAAAATTTAAAATTTAAAATTTAAAATTTPTTTTSSGELMAVSALVVICSLLFLTIM